MYVYVPVQSSLLCYTLFMKMWEDVHIPRHVMPNTLKRVEYDILS